MTETSPIAWKRIAVESPVIVISILLAFAIDAWWEERRERQAEITLLERLQADFTEIQTALDIVDKEHREARDACVFFMNLAVGEPLANTAGVDRKVGLVFFASRTFNPGSGAVAPFLGSEGAQLVRNQLLADKLMAWSGLVEELQEEEANLQKGVAERWTPFIASRVPVGPYVAVFEVLAREMPDHVAAPAIREPLVVDDEFLNHVLDRYKWQQLALRDIEPVSRAVEEILALLKTELGS